MGGGIVLGLTLHASTVDHHRYALRDCLEFGEMLTFPFAMLVGIAFLVAALLWSLRGRRGEPGKAGMLAILTLFGSTLLGWPAAVEMGRQQQADDLDHAVQWCDRLVPLIEAERQRTGAYPTDLRHLNRRLPPRPPRLDGYLHYEVRQDGYELRIELLTSGAIAPDHLVWTGDGWRAW